MPHHLEITTFVDVKMSSVSCRYLKEIFKKCEKWNMEIYNQLLNIRVFVNLYSLCTNRQLWKIVHSIHYLYYQIWNNKSFFLYTSTSDIVKPPLNLLDGNARLLQKQFSQISLIFFFRMQAYNFFYSSFLRKWIFNAKSCIIKDIEFFN